VNLCVSGIGVDVRTGKWVICGKPAIQLHRYGCVHEHVVERWTCREHSPEPDMVGCRACWDAGHECPMAFQAVTA